MLNTLAAVLLTACLGTTQVPAIALIIDDLGNRAEVDFAALSLPGRVTFAILPFSPLTQRLAKSVNSRGGELLLHLPMEAESNNHLLGPGALLRSMDQAEFLAALRKALDDVPGLIGVSNHMGSLLTRDSERMRWLMTELRSHGDLVYVDSRTTAGTVARKAARQANVPYLARDVFLDNRREAAYIEHQLDNLIARAQAQGSAVGIAHPYPETIEVLARRLETLEHVQLISLRELAARRACQATLTAGALDSKAPDN